MCGIAGIASLNGRTLVPDAIQRMCNSIAHRGPDDAGYTFFRRNGQGDQNTGYWCDLTDPEFRHLNEHLPVFGGRFFQDEMALGDFTVALGHRRLSIIDLTHYGHQPMASGDRRFWIVYNGEIYNFAELRDRLIQMGHIFRSRCDTEVLVHLWQEYGEDCLPMLDGMFAFAIYDCVENRLTLARDRFGVKPLYYAARNGVFAFASEIKGVLACGFIPAVIDPVSLVEYITFQNLFGSATIFQDVHMLPAGCLLSFQPAQGLLPEPRKYHDGFPGADTSITGGEATCERVKESFQNAVRRQLVSDVEVGSYLSGGMDSGSIVAVASQTIPRLLTFTCGFDLTNVNGLEQGFDERRMAEQLSYLLQTEHYDVVLHSGDMPAVMEQLTWHLDDPRAGMCHQNWYAAKLASRFVKVCLAGTGGDELFAGYPWRYLNGLGAQSFDEFDDVYFRYWHRMLPPETIPQLFSLSMRRYTAEMRERFAVVMSDAPAWQNDMNRVDNLLQRALHFEFKTFLHGLLVVEDRISMAHGLETRVPFLDNDLADLAFRMPPSLKFGAKVINDRLPSEPLQSTDGKRILREAMELVLPREFTRQPKQGFSPPDENWYRGPSMQYLKDVLFDRHTLERPWFDQTFVKQRLLEHFEGRCNHRLLIWSLLCVEWLQRHYTDSCSLSQLSRSA